MLQAAGGAAGDHEEQCDGEWPLPVSALWGGAGLPGQLIGVLQRLQEGKALLWLPSLDQPCYSVALHPGSQECVCVYVHAYMCAHIVSYASWQEGLGPEGQMARLLVPALGSGPLGLTGLGVNSTLPLAV